jgi:flavin reductase (DIM6/NTAB) family NADH-FMN oxidoreductase RutF
VSPAVSGEGLTAALARFATGVTVLSIRDDEDEPADDLAATVTAFMPVSLFPPVVAVALGMDGYLAEVLDRRPDWGLSVLAAGQTALAGRFSADGRPSARHLLGDEPHHRGGQTGALLLDGGCATFECRTTDHRTVGDHLLLTADVLAAAVNDGQEPLVRYDRAYRRLGPR